MVRVINLVSRETRSLNVETRIDAIKAIRQEDPLVRASNLKTYKEVSNGKLRRIH